MSRRSTFVDEVIEEIANEPGTPAPRSTPAGRLLYQRTHPVPIRDRLRRDLAIELLYAFGLYEPDLIARWLRSFADDVEAIGYEAAIHRFRDRILPRLLPNEPPGNGR